jgi:hypothetical protein
MIRGQKSWLKNFAAVVIRRTGKISKTKKQMDTDGKYSDIYIRAISQIRIHVHIAEDKVNFNVFHCRKIYLLVLRIYLNLKRLFIVCTPVS